MAERYRKGQIGYEEAKNTLALAIASRFSRPAEIFEEWMKRPDDIRDVLRNGAEAVSTEVHATLVLIRERMGLAL